MSRSALRSALTARYDAAALRVEPPMALDAARVAALGAQRPEPWSALERWCHEPGPLACAMLQGRDAGALAQAFARVLDGTVLLESAGGGLGRLAIRLRVKLHDAMPWRARRRADPWDCGWWIDTPETRAALGRFEPRRATLVACADAAAMARATALLAARADAFAHPVRLLAVEATSEPLRLSAASPCAGSR